MKKLFLVSLLLACLGVMMAQMQDKLKQEQAWGSFIGCTKACSDYLGYYYSRDWICGISGYAFFLNIHPELCPSGPTAFDSGFLKQNLESLGLDFDVINFSAGDGDLESWQQKAFEQVKLALQADHPVFAWELDIPEYYLIAGTDDKGYQFFDFDGKLKHCAWDKIATSEIGMAEFCILKKGKVLDTREQVKTLLEFLDGYQTDASSKIISGYSMGSDAYDVWLKAMQEGEFNPWGLAYNTQVWSEARHSAVGFLQELRQALGKDKKYKALDQAIASYESVANAMQQINLLYPFPPQKEGLSAEDGAKITEYLKQAQKAETEGLQALLELRNNL